MAPSSAFADICRKVCEDQNWELLPTGIVVRWGDGRHQLVSLEFFEWQREELVRLSTIIGGVEDVTREQLITALAANAELAHGALAIYNDHLCMTDTLMVGSSGAPEVEAAIAYLARLADDYEHVIFGTDRY